MISRRRSALCSQRRRSPPLGFTLIELLVVVVIIGILASIAVGRYAKAKERAYTASMQSDLRNIVTAQEMFYESGQAYTNNASLLPVQLREGVTVTGIQVGTLASTWRATVAHARTNITCSVVVNDPLLSSGVMSCQ